MLAYILLVVMFIVVAMMWTEGMWSNGITLINVVFAGIVSWNLFEPAAGFLEPKMPSFTYVVDFLCFWVLFILTYNIFKAMTDQISTHAVRFKKPVEQTGRVLFAMMTAWVMTCIICASLHLAPLGRSPMKGSFAQEPKSNCFFGLAPDRMWLAFMHTRSKKGLSTMKKNTFDPDGSFVLKYGTRRKNLEAHNKKTDGKIRTKNR